ncbi:hypothetical protein EJF36_08390 [Bacillus sp. HMF5848]|uniref:DUF5325 family protein n=1 Tax=Bacillus sp. HMF5848 TaxID=2495421 RepID=UPI000F7AC490|nr:DUF5325 family protein [Bacillus sp. HMF5848]RSK26883.1 hypothetical protein EJF36_08390 [Bacillus sp. HMF5848]
MQLLNITMLIFAIAGVIAMSLVGIFIAEGHALGIIGSLLAVIIIMGAGFMTKKKLQRAGKL